MAKTQVRPASKRPIRRSADDSLSGDFARFLHGEDGRAAEVEVEVMQYTFDHAAQEAMVKHKLEATNDFSSVDFFLPLLLLAAIFLMQYIFSVFRALPMFSFIALGCVFILQSFLLLDLWKRITRRPNGKMAVGLVKPYENGKYGWGWAFLVYTVCAPVIFAVAFINQFLMQKLFPSVPAMNPIGREGMGSVFRTDFTASFLLGMGLMFLVAIGVILFEVVVFAPVCEELWFRGIGLTSLMKTGSATRAVVWTSLVFGALHGPDRFLFTTLFGIVLALIRFRTGSLYCCIAIHALHNFLAIVLSVVLALWTAVR